jgi:hypothetical protein
LFPNQILTLLYLLLTTAANPGFFSKGPDPVLLEAKEKTPPRKHRSLLSPKPGTTGRSPPVPWLLAVWWSSPSVLPLVPQPANISYMEQDDWDHAHPHRQASTAAPPTSWAKTLKRTFTRHLQPAELPVPVVDADLPRLSGIERSAEVIRFTLNRLEYRLSPFGHLT